MAGDFGDYSGEKLCDWILRMGQDAGGSAAMAADPPGSWPLRKIQSQSLPPE